LSAFETCNTTHKTYGVLGGGIALLVWLYWSSFVILLGAELNSEICASPQSKTHQEQCILKSSLISGPNFSVALNGQARGTPS
jgi:uncharacterized BrkB/YihY/UPF0761 family membrane protein